MDRFLVEVGRRTIGIAVRGSGGYRFFCSDPEFRSLDGRVFSRARALTSAVEGLAAGRFAPSTTASV